MTATEVGLTDTSTLLRSKIAECSAIATSRKRKLRELFAVATAVEDLPELDLTNPDVPPTTPAETKFLFDNDIFQGRKLSEYNIPPRPKPSLAVLGRFLGAAAKSQLESIPGTAKLVAAKGVQHAQQPKLGQESKQDTTHQRSPSPAYVISKDGASRIDPSSRIAQNGLADVDVAGNQVGASIGNLPISHGTPRTLPSKSNASTTVTVTGDTPEIFHSPVAEGHLRAPTTNVRSRSRTPVGDEPPEMMDVDKDATPHHDVGEKERALSNRLPGAETLKPADAMSSPGSTTHSATTPAIHDASTDTSPDNEGSHYVDGDDEDVEQAKSVGDSHGMEAEPSRDAIGDTSKQINSDGQKENLVNGVEAQLLQESAAARLAQGAEDSAGSTTPVEVVDPPAVLSSHTPFHTAGGSARDVSSLDGRVDILQDKASAGSKAARSQFPDSKDLDKPVPPQLSVTVPEAQISSDSRALPKSPSQPLDSARTPRSEHAPSALHSPTTERVTRIGSGALRQKSVTEILGETPKPTSNHDTDGSSSNVEKTQSSDKNSAAGTISVVSKGIEKRRRSVPTVVFGKHVKAASRTDEAALNHNRHDSGQLPVDDYFTPLFIDGFTRQSKWMKPIEQLLHHAHKTVSTSDQYVSVLDHQACRLLRRVYQLQQHDKWSLRQPMRCPEPARPTAHWDVLLQEMKWMRTDFREERKWKRAVARNIAYACAEWFEADPDGRKALQVNAVIPPRPAPTDASNMEVEGGGDSIPELAHTDSPMNNDEEPVDDAMLIETVAPSAIFAMQDDEVIFGLQRSQIADKLLDELPLYGSPLVVPKVDLNGPEIDPDAHWKRPALPLSKYVEGRMILAATPRPKKRSRYHYEREDSDDENEHVVFGSNSERAAISPPQNTSVALFNPEMKLVRDRLHAGHQFRPPTEYPMPLQNFYESRQASQWTWAEDDELKSLVREYSYNWSLISSMISTKSAFASGAERRTPWECFERWVNLEGLPNDMSKTQYFKTYHNRIEAAQRVIKQQNEAAQQQIGANGAVTPIPRRRPTTTVRVERRRNQKHLALIDAMRKLAKKRETAVQKAQNAANMAAMRKANEVQRQPGPVKTPTEYSLMRWERDQQLAEKMAQYAQRQQELQRRALQARSQGQAGQVPAINANPQSTQGAPPATVAAAAAAATALANGVRPNVPGQVGAAGQPRPRMPMQPPPAAMAAAAVQAQINGGLVPPLPLNGIQHAQLQAMQAQHRMSSANPQPDLNLVMQARRIQDQQRAAVQMQLQAAQQQQHQQVQQLQQPGLQQHQQAQQAQQAHQSPMAPGGTTAQISPNSMRTMSTGINQQNFLANAQAMMGSFNPPNGGGMGSPNGVASGLSMPTMPGGSPRPPTIPPSQMPAVAAQLRELENSYRMKFPNASQDQVRQHAMEHLSRLLVQRQQQFSQSAMNAAAGGAGPMTPQQTHAALANGMAASTSPHQYAQLLRAQQQAQQAQVAAAHAQQQQQQQAGQQLQRQASASSATPVPGK